jgi:hypothetical protein
VVEQTSSFIQPLLSQEVDAQADESEYLSKRKSERLTSVVANAGSTGQGSANPQYVPV